MNIETFIEPIQARHAVLTFTGWPDAGRITELALAELKQRLPHTPAAKWDLDGFWHIETMRPQVLVQHGQIQQLAWPAYEMTAVSPPDAAPILLGTGPEPGCRWQTFSRELVTLLKGWGCESLYLLGSLNDQVFHDEVVISSVVQDSHGFNQARELECQRIEYQGPAAVQAAVMAAAREADLHCLGFWAHLSFYLQGPHELIMARLLQILARLLALELDVSDLVARWQQHLLQIEEFVAQNEDLQRILESAKGDRQARQPQSLPAKVINLDDFLKKKHEPAPEDD